MQRYVIHFTCETGINFVINTELQIRGGIKDNSKDFFLFLNEKVCCNPSLELSWQDGSNDGLQHTC